MHLLPSERAALCESGFATGGLAEDGRAAGADDDGLCVREDGGDSEAAGALDVHEEGAGGWDKGLWRLLVDCGLAVKCGGRSYLQLVLSGLSLRRWVEEVDCENLLTWC